MSSDNKHDLQKADSLANWSFTGIALPVIGWILALISKHTVNDLEPATDLENKKIQKISRKTTLSLVLSIAAFIAQLTLVAWLTVEYGDYEAKVQQQQQAQEIQLQQQSSAKHEFLNQCLEHAHKSYEEAWATESQRLGRTDGLLPDSKANIQDQRYENSKNDCYRNAELN